MCINTLLFLFSFFNHKTKGSKTNNKKREKKGGKKKREWKKQIKTKEINKKDKKWNEHHQKNLCLLVVKQNFIKIIVSHFHFHFLPNLGRSSFGGLGEKIVGPYHFSTPSHLTHLLSYFPLLFFHHFQNYPNQTYL